MVNHDVGKETNVAANEVAHDEACATGREEMDLLESGICFPGGSSDAEYGCSYGTFSGDECFGAQQGKEHWQMRHPKKKVRQHIMKDRWTTGSEQRGASKWSC